MVKNSSFERPKIDSGRSYTIKFGKKNVTEVWGNNEIVIRNKYKKIGKCKFENTVTGIESKLIGVEDFYFVGQKTTYEIVET